MVTESNLQHNTEPAALHIHAMDNIKFIRDTMQNASSFTAVPGWGSVGMGVTALIAAAIASQISSPSLWMAAWGIEAIIAVTIGSSALLYKASHCKADIHQGVGRKFLCNLMTPLLAAVPLTVILHTNGLHHDLPGLWLLMYGTGIVTAGAFSVRIVPAMGIGFMLLGLLSLALPGLAPDLAMALGFGVLHIISGWMVAKYYGG